MLPIVFSIYLSKLLVLMQIILIFHREGFNRGLDILFDLITRMIRLQLGLKYGVKNMQKITKS